jgi:hypothetical protein
MSTSAASRLVHCLLNDTSILRPLSPALIQYSNHLAADVCFGGPPYVKPDKAVWLARDESLSL